MTCPRKTQDDRVTCPRKTQDDRGDRVSCGARPIAPAVRTDHPPGVTRWPDSGGTLAR
ncbi:hypothetical protein SAV14893_070330 [Streptomyces avermitilis]|uniref:Uncharacterized protein n=1 Tax=Streptomyces avermitilis TaxID=33903 RepID=A0A4D4MK31_STRAX|nr:hypothetical protein SAVMC3_83140 [Streptomyces avermitilis]GDY67640.1 hypothetical protein SAV14893_070330 [Streptomyces avermitilis]GDY72054.1 hypothetical protein SAV31267_015390 [Streptomyces avermitilis]GDY81213.1 hypothetical protein SAVCW2_04120 [Streptomyces avermitilis]